MNIRFASLALAFCLALPATQLHAQETNPDTAELNRLLVQSLERKAAIREARQREREREAAEAEAAGAEDAAAEDLLDMSAEAVADAAEAVLDAAEDAGAPEPVYVFDATIVEDYLKSSPPYGIRWMPRLEAFDLAVRDALAKEPSVDSAASALLAQTDLSQEQLATLIRLWVEAEFFEFIFGEGLVPERDRWREEMIAFAQQYGDAPIVIEVAAIAFDGQENCATDIPLRLIEGREDRPDVVWRAARANRCPKSMNGFVSEHPEFALGAIIHMEDYGRIELAGKLPIAAWLVRDEALARVAPEDREAVATVLYRRHLTNLLSAGFTTQAVAFIESQPESTVSRILEPDERDFFATVDGLPALVSAEEDTSTLRGSVATAYFLAGREEAARAMLQQGGALEKQRAWLDCAINASPTEKKECAQQRDPETWALMLGHMLDTPSEDPYPLAETFFGNSFLSSTGGGLGAGAELQCRLFAEARFGDICANLSKYVASRLLDHESSYNREDHDSAMAAIESNALPEFATLQAEYARLVDAKLEQTGRPEPRSFRRESIDPIHPSFAERPLPEGVAPYSPEAAAGNGDEEETRWPEGWAELSPGFWPVRWEQDGERAAVVSVSPYYNPSGEISQGGYWVHLSENSGRSWKTPLFTGLAQYWPYIVAPQSGLPMIGEDRLTIEVAVFELDTASITYPPVGLATRREETGLVLEIPLERLTADSDSDGLSDLAEAHLLLDREGDARPFILGSGNSEQCPRVPTRQTLATAAMLSRIFRVDSQAIIEPIGRSGDALEFGKWQRKEDPIMAPLFLRGDPADFACVDAGQPVLVYSPEQVKELQRRSPDFRTVELPKGVWNADRTRGFVEWSAGWTGGTLRLIWTDGEWVIDEISRWIT